MNILLVTMEMQVGGAETHVFELAKELKKRGNNVIVMSAGGKYADELEKAGIKHIYAPLKNKKPQNILKSYKIIKETVINEKIDVVHAHARIPGFISGLVCKKLKLPLVTTVHGIYKVTPILKLLTNWGEKTLTVSEDIKSQVIKDYKLNPEDVSVTVNGINTDVFSNGKSVVPELNDAKFKVVHVSRLDIDSSDVAEKLINIIDELNKRLNKNLELVIVGTGDKFEDLKELSKNKDDVKMLGLRTDVSEILKAGNLFVGVSRAALEAMATQLPVILAGNPNYHQGYIGIFDKNKLENAISTNFCCRDCEEVTNEKLIRDILEIYDMSKEEKEEMGKYNRSVVEDMYSVDKMVNDCEKMYKEVLK